MTSRGENYHLCCEEITKYRRINCLMPVCNRCTPPEQDEKVEGWRAGMFVGCCNDRHIVNNSPVCLNFVRLVEIHHFIRELSHA